jgi:two-component system response regulator WspF
VTSLRVAIVNDMTLACEVLRRLLSASPAYTIAWIARDGAEAVRCAAADPPDVILMDLIMPVMDGVEATRRIMQQSPCPILIVTSSVATNFAQVYEAMGHGALDAVDTPVLGHGSEVRQGEALLSRLAKLERERTAVPARPAAVSLALPAHVGAAVAPLVALGASTGGPDALASILRALPVPCPAAILVAQHIGADFTPSLAHWLQASTPLPVRLAVAGAEPRPGEVVLAASNDHLILRPDRRLAYTAEPLANPFRPSVDVLFASLAAHWPRRGIAALLTGMGHDGGQGLLQLRERGWFTIAQDEASSIVYGMPRAAAELGAACRVAPLAEIGALIRAQLGANSPAG